jgi:hypothetical protein
VKYSFSIFVFFLLLVDIKGQDSAFMKIDTIPSGSTYLLNKVTRDGETLPEAEIKVVSIVSHRSLASRFQYWKYQRLIFNIKRVYPYAIIVREKLLTVNTDLQNMTGEKERKQYLKQVEKDVFANYEDDMREMTITQGRLLIKLIDRETSNTSFELLKDYKGKFSAAFWQGVARIFGTNLKEEYDPAGDDALVEFIILEIDSGKL